MDLDCLFDDFVALNHGGRNLKNQLTPESLLKEADASVQTTNSPKRKYSHVFGVDSDGEHQPDLPNRSIEWDSGSDCLQGMVEIIELQEMEKNHQEPCSLSPEVINRQAPPLNKSLKTCDIYHEDTDGEISRSPMSDDSDINSDIMIDMGPGHHSSVENSESDTEAVKGNEAIAKCCDMQDKDRGKCQDETRAVQREEKSKSDGDTQMSKAGESYFSMCGEERRFIDAAFGGTDNKLVLHEPSGKNDMLQVCYQACKGRDEFYGLGEKVKKAVFDTFGIIKLHIWQHDMLQSHIAEKPTKNGLVLAPTSGGKTLVAIILMLRCLLLEGKDAIVTLPYVAIVAEKVRQLRILATKLGSIAVLEYAGSKGYIPPARPKPSLRTVYVATPEKANSLWKALCREGERSKEVGLTIMDEFHLLRDRVRGIVLEELVVNILHCGAGSNCLIALSATVGNPCELKSFLGGGNPDNCTVYVVTSRPRNIAEHVIVSGVKIPVLRHDHSKAEVQYTARPREMVLPLTDPLANGQLKMFTNNEDRILAKLVFDSMARNAPVIVFCNTRNKCLKLCEMLTDAYIEVHGDQTCTALMQKQRSNVIGHLQEESKGMVQRSLLNGIRHGIAFHSAALHASERIAIEDAFSKGILLVIVSTSTLAAGVNLPASRIIIRSPKLVDEYISYSSYLQMVGRAGRGGCESETKDFKPDAYLMLQSADMEWYEKMLELGIENVTSQLLNEATYYKRTASGSNRERNKEHNFTGITRMILACIDLTEQVVEVQTILQVYKTTLLYQSGEKETVMGKNIRKLSIKPLLRELQNVISSRYVELLQHDQEVGLDISVEEVLDDSEDAVRVECQLHQDVQPQDERTYVVLTETELGVILQRLATAQEVGGRLTIANYGLRMTLHTLAATAGNMCLEDAEEFRLEAEKLQASIDMTNPLTFLYLSITADMSREMTEPSAHNPNAISIPTLVSVKVLNNYSKNPDFDLLQKVGLLEERIGLWSIGHPSQRKNAAFVNTIKRMWSAMFVRDLCMMPDRFEEHCLTYGFDRGTAMELSASLASRCLNLKNYCSVLDKSWWYAPLSKVMVGRLTDAAKDEIRPLLTLRHALHTTVRDVATVHPPTILSDKIRYLSKWRAVEMVLDARMQIAQEATQLAAESRDRQQALE